MVPKEACEERAQRHEKVSGWICFGEEREEEEDDDWRLHVDEIVCGAVGRGGRLTPCLGVFQWWTSENGEEAGEEGTWREWARFEGAFCGKKMETVRRWSPPPCGSPAELEDHGRMGRHSARLGNFLQLWSAAWCGNREGLSGGWGLVVWVWEESHGQRRWRVWEKCGEVIDIGVQNF